MTGSKYTVEYEGLPKSKFELPYETRSVRITEGLYMLFSSYGSTYVIEAAKPQMKDYQEQLHSYKRMAWRLRMWRLIDVTDGVPVVVTESDRKTDLMETAYELDAERKPDARWEGIEKLTEK